MTGEECEAIPLLAPSRGFSVLAAPGAEAALGLGTVTGSGRSTGPVLSSSSQRTKGGFVLL